MKHRTKSKEKKTINTSILSDPKDFGNIHISCKKYTNEFYNSFERKECQFFKLTQPLLKIVQR